MTNLPFRPLKSLWLLLPLLLSLGSCKKTANLLSFKVEDSSTVNLPPTPTGSYTLPGIPVLSTSANTYKNNNTQAKYVQDVTLDYLNMTLTAPAGSNFDFLQSVSLEIASDATGANKMLLASLNPVPKGQTVIHLNPTTEKLDVYLRNDSYTLFTTAVLTQPLKQTTTLKTDVRYSVRARQP